LDIPSADAQPSDPHGIVATARFSRNKVVQRRE
jgi:hypothetical protein